jgi:hypothetical protein
MKEAVRFKVHPLVERAIEDEVDRIVQCFLENETERAPSGFSGYAEDVSWAHGLEFDYEEGLIREVVVGQGGNTTPISARFEYINKGNLEGDPNDPITQRELLKKAVMLLKKPIVKDECIDGVSLRRYFPAILLAVQDSTLH